MKTLLKIVTILFFLSGIVIFVGYQSGYFYRKQRVVSMLPFRVEKKQSVPYDSSVENVPKDSLKKWLIEDSVGSRIKVKQFPDNSESATIKLSPEERRLIMSSSKSLTIVEPQGYDFEKTRSKILTILSKKKIIDPSIADPRSVKGPKILDLERLFPENWFSQGPAAPENLSAADTLE